MRFRRANPNHPPKPQRSTRGRMIITGIAGALCVFAFAPFGWWPLEILGLATLFYQVLRSTSVKAAALIGWAFVAGWTAAGVHWLYVSLHTYGQMAAPLAVIAVLLLGAAMGLYGAAAMASAWWLRQRWKLPLPAANLLLFPAMWALFEWIRGWLFTGFPWLSSGYAHNHSPLAGFAPIIGMYGLGWLAAIIAGALLLLLHRTRLRAAGLVVVICVAGVALSFLKWTWPEGKPISVRLIQGNIPQDEKFNGAHVQQTMKLYQDAITAAPADLIATPETAIIMLPQQLPPDYLPGIAQFLNRTGSNLILGIFTADSQTAYFNSVIGLPPKLGRGYYRYDKHHLVPYGEFIPYGFRWFVNLMSIPLGDMTSGKEIQPAFPIKDQRVLPNICYEDLFGEEIAAQLNHPAEDQKPATMLLNTSNLAWFGDTIAIPQHLQISQMRSLETGRPMLRATNTGATAIINGEGKVVQQLPVNSFGTLAANVQGMSGSTPYILWGNKLFLLLLALAVAGAWFWAKRAKNQPNAA
ncbi:apolipoprotein N-acyltransferase [Duganella sp. FT80W]|uniref:Apolipoprotein N-acyltransferase n=1 Tax=Duganella guangzhouensis TaxID=2666084 RepID=A0A6I2L3K5_9BURK|nr:apolipoprotein N-acyltransferase [Duganella guangzhouensis]MRW92711.1 apolipoprotein N-acyltransferase [Duganella guangzhouensis]